MGLKPDNYTQFRISKPWGYYPPEVEEMIKQYEETIGALTDKYEESQQECLRLSSTIEGLQNELRRMHLEMTSLELPDATETVEHYVLDEFKSYNSGSNNNNNNNNSHNNYNQKTSEDEASEFVFNLANADSQDIKNNNKDLPFTIAE